MGYIAFLFCCVLAIIGSMLVKNHSKIVWYNRNWIIIKDNNKKTKNKTFVLVDREKGKIWADSYDLDTLINWIPKGDENGR